MTDLFRSLGLCKSGNLKAAGSAEGGQHAAVSDVSRSDTRRCHLLQQLREHRAAPLCIGHHAGALYRYADGAMCRELHCWRRRSEPELQQSRARERI